MLVRLFRRAKPKPVPQHDAFYIRRGPRPLSVLGVRPYVPADFDVCMDLYKKNEPGRFPRNQSDHYAAHLRERKALILILEEDGKVVGTGGISANTYPPELVEYWLTYGFITRHRQRHGLGTVLLLARISLLPDTPSTWPVLLTSVWRSRSFYEQFGFRLFSDGSEYEPPIAGCFATRIAQAEVAGARSYLRESGVQMPEDGLTIPCFQKNAGQKA